DVEEIPGGESVVIVIRPDLASRSPVEQLEDQSDLLLVFLYTALAYETHAKLLGDLGQRRRMILVPFDGGPPDGEQRRD
ncbi:unnamed protein product, partial [marine sediment metagenome]